MQIKSKENPVKNNRKKNHDQYLSEIPKRLHEENFGKKILKENPLVIFQKKSVKK